MPCDYTDPPHAVAAQPGWDVVTLEYVDDATLAAAQPETVLLRFSPVVAWRIDFHRRRTPEMLYEHAAGSWTGGHEVSAISIDGGSAGPIGEEMLRSPSGQFLVTGWLTFDDEFSAWCELLRRERLRRQHWRDDQERRATRQDDA